MDLFKKFEVNNLHQCRGGVKTATSVSTANAGPDGCTKDSQDIEQCQVPGQSEGTTQTDRSNFQWECGVATGGGIGVGVTSPVGIQMI